MKNEEKLYILEDIEEKILADGKVEPEEIEVLKDFVSKIDNGVSSKITRFNNILEKSLEDGVITNEETTEIFEMLDCIKSNLKIQVFVDRIFSVVISFGFLMLITIFLKKFSIFL